MVADIFFNPISQEPGLPKDYFKILLFLKGSLGLGRKRNEKLACVCVSCYSHY